MYIVVPATIGAASTPRVVPSENVPKTCSFCTFILLISVRPLNLVPWKSFAGRTHWPSSANFVVVSPLVVAGPTRAASATRGSSFSLSPLQPARNREPPTATTNNRRRSETHRVRSRRGMRSPHRPPAYVSCRSRCVMRPDMAASRVARLCRKCSLIVGLAGLVGGREINGLPIYRKIAPEKSVPERARRKGRAGKSAPERARRKGRAGKSAPERARRKERAGKGAPERARRERREWGVQGERSGGRGEEGRGIQNDKPPGCEGDGA